MTHPHGAHETPTEIGTPASSGPATRLEIRIAAATGRAITADLMTTIATEIVGATTAHDVSATLADTMKTAMGAIRGRQMMVIAVTDGSGTWTRNGS